MTILPRAADIARDAFGLQHFFHRISLFQLGMAVPLCASILASVCTANVFTVVNTNPVGAGSLHQAILDANANPGHDEIHFNITPAGPQTILPTGQYPTITDPVLIDGSTQPGFSGAPLIEIDGSSTGGSFAAECFLIHAGSTTIRSLCINNFGRSAIRIESSDYNVVEGCYLGTDLSGTQRKQNVSHGIMALGSDHNRFGGATESQRNLISGNVSHGILVDRAGDDQATNNIIQGNYIGTDVTGSLALANGTGVSVSGFDHVIGGTGTGEGNLI